MVKSAAVVKLEPIVAKVMVSRIQRHLQATLDAVHKVLQGVDGGDTGLSSLTLPGEGGKTFRLPVAWPALKPAYSRRKLQAYRGVFWRAGVKGGRRRGAARPLMDSWALSGPSASVNLASIRPKPGGRQLARGFRFELEVALHVGKLPNPLDDLVRKPFFKQGSSVAVTDYTGRVSRGNLTKLVYVEGSRPFVHDLALHMGQVMYEELNRKR